MTIALEKSQEKRMHSPKPVTRAIALFLFVVSLVYFFFYSQRFQPSQMIA